MITLITDFGVASEYAGVMKGVMFSHSFKASIIDISHSVPPQDIVQAAYMLKASFAYFPKGTIHVVVVDPGVGSGRDIVLLEAAGYKFLLPDNGVATLLMDDPGIDRAYRLSCDDLFLQPVSATFHGRDIFAPVAAKLDAGMECEEVGPEIDVEKLVQLQIPEPLINHEQGEIAGEVICTDSYGSLISNISRDNIFDCGYDRSISNICVIVGAHTVRELSFTYNDVEKGLPVALIGSRGFLEVAVNGGNAARQLQANKGTTVKTIIRQ